MHGWLISVHLLSGNHGEGDDTQLGAVVANDVVPDDDDVADKGAAVGVTESDDSNGLTGAHVPHDQRSLPAGDEQPVVEHGQTATAHGLGHL